MPSADYIAHLQKDKKLAAIIQAPVHERIQPHANIALQLIGSIMSQQLNTKVAKIIYQRFLDLFPQYPPRLQQVSSKTIEDLRSIGLSNAKANYVLNVAAFCAENKITDQKLYNLSDEEIINLLTQIKGVGRWTVEMLLMFALGREDVFSADDFGVRQAMIKIYKLQKLNGKELREKLFKISSKWSPYRTYACLYLWQWKDNKAG